MDRHELELGAQYARDLCSRVGARAPEVGFLDGTITAKLHDGRVKRVNLEMFDPSDALPAVLSYPEVSLAEARHILRTTLQETLERCIVPFGDVTMWFTDGVLGKVWFTEKFRIEEEVPDMARLFVSSLGRSRNGHGSRKTRVGGSGRPR